MSSNEMVLEVKGLSAGYGNVAVVRDVNISVMPGEVVALLGPNGAGKTTTLLTISGLLDPIEGSIRYMDQEIGGVAAHRIARMGVVQVPEDRSLFFGLTVEENLRLARRSERHSEYELFPELVPLKSRKAGLLSGGEQQMLAMARSLAADPNILLVDEMSLGLAPIIVERLFERLNGIARSANLAVLMVEQHVHLALANSVRAYVMAHGLIRAEGPSEELGSRWSEIEAAYLGSGVEDEVVTPAGPR